LPPLFCPCKNITFSHFRKFSLFLRNLKKITHPTMGFLVGIGFIKRHVL